MSSLNKIRLEDGTELSVAEWLHQPVFSGMAIDHAQGIDLNAFNYVVGQPISANGASLRRNATESDTNIVRKRAMNQDEALIVFSITYEVFGASEAGADLSPTPSLEGYGEAPSVTAENLRRLQRDCMVELYVGAGIKKPQVQVPFSWIHQSIGSPSWMSSYTGVVDGSSNLSERSYGTGGVVSARNQELLKLPVYIGGFGENARPGNMMTFYLRFFSPNGVVKSLDQTLYINWHLDGLKKRPA